MDYKRLIDLHVHTDNSPDGHHAAMLICETAVAKGLRAVAFTDHCEVDVYFDDKYDRVVRQSYFEVARAKSAYRGNLLVLQGVELAQPTYDEELALKIIDARNYDMIIGSIHNLRGESDFYYTRDFEGMDIDSMLKAYFRELAVLADWGQFDTLAHLTYPLRYFYARNNISVDMEEYACEVDEILKLLAENHIALEINTAGLRQPIKKLAPEFPIVKRFRELGGKYITIGSDAHYAEHLAAGFDDALEVAQEAGFDCVTLFQNRDPVEIPIG
ncbi:MAG: histidinol-phosphatase HisJ family protein [Oscillospiraceae bacterium]|jgi:histidinol-phosphatase (PHP family)|nr:histidinol-phosphatase HisJ family protein [Oscillospiraceae bacterium]